MPIYYCNKEIEVNKFSGGELSVNVNNMQYISGRTVILDCYLHNSDDIIALLLIVDAIRRNNYSEKDIDINLIIKYFPYARQDRVCNKGESLSLKVMCNLINSLNCRVTVYDPHSDVLEALLERCLIVRQENIIRSFYSKFVELKLDAIIAPDAGAEKKAIKVAQDIKLPLYCASKVRDTLTGNIIATRFTEDVTGLNVLICDDICDGGRTFIELAKKLKENGADSVYLYVTHGIFSNGLEVLKPCIDKIFCYNVFPDVEQDTSYLVEL